MEILYKLPELISNCEIKVKDLLSVITREVPDFSSVNKLYHGNNIDAMIDLINRGYGNSIDLIYIDPPFFTKANYNNRVEIVFQGNKEVVEYKAYDDIWKGGLEEYLEELTIRLMLMKELLSDKGTIYVHIDFRTVHYIKVIMDYIYGLDNFLNEIIWAYKSGGTSNKYFSRKHDNILVYTKTKNYIFNPQKEKSYNRGYKPYRFKGVKEYEDSLGWYTLVNLKDVWQIDMVGRTSGERVGYETQKPEALLERIILSSSNKDSIIADFYSGSGTTLSVAQKLNRQWIGSDIGNCSILTVMKRLGQIGMNNYIKIDLNNGGISNDTSIKYDILVDNGKYIINIDEYDFNIECFKFSRKNHALIEEILNKDSIALIDYISVVTEDEEIIYEDFKTKSKERINTEIEIGIDNLNELLYVNVIDIFGNLTCLKLNNNSDTSSI
jgi:site-specific DNA-methyltransferase (adenine-specific)